MSVAPQSEGASTVELKASAVYGTEGVNADFTSVTPWGELRMGIELTAPAASVLKEGDDIYLYLEKIEKE
ncbi:hypothetical protein DYBT9275_02758 [Dyadobacter sp. CECT 9275]|uniref:Uncharacterized protein n=2 Tax=Dyadobacter helix TaxID=2822344 RepID=A0A916JCS3_9BACT|nr:hypothetical protein DYBT9275_02758 [Dyadobacter sp. CECT 9275]